MEDVMEEKKMEENGTKKLPVGRVLGAICEGVWTVIKIVVVIGIITAIVGVLLSRNLMIRGRNGARQSTKDMSVAAATLSNKSEEDDKVKEWLSTVTREKVTMVADDKYILIARKVVVDAESDKWAVILHGYNGSMADIYDIAMHYTENGYNVLMPDLRACGESEGSFIGMGWLDRLDVINWVDVILEENPSAKVVIHGVDMGADAALMLSGEPIKSSIKAIVAEGAYTSAWDVLKKEYQARYSGKPVFPFLNMVNPVMKVWAGYTLKEANAVKQVSKTNVPILLVHGGKDTYVTEDMMKKLNDAISSQHELFTVASGTHEDCRYAEPDNYYNKTFEFVDTYTK